VDAFAGLRDMPTPYRPDIPMYTTMVAMHVWAMTGVPQTNHPELAGFDLGYGHGGPAAPTWHRAFSRLMEHALQEVTGDRTFALPYWDWSRYIFLLLLLRVCPCYSLICIYIIGLYCIIGPKVTIWMRYYA
jgi:hypothetical protein